MPAIEKRGANSYRLTVSRGYDSNNKKITKKKTITLPPNLSEKQIEAELNKQLVLFQKEVENGTYLDGNKITFSEFADKWFSEYAEVHLRPKTITRYRQLLQRILISLGHIKLDKLQPTHLMEFYKNLSEGGIRLDYSYSLKKDCILDITKFKQKAKEGGIKGRTVSNILKGNFTDKNTAEKIVEAMNIKLSDLFSVENKEKSLSSRTINHHHKLISAMLTTAVQWQLILSNPATRIKAPKTERTEAKFYSKGEVANMLKLLDNEPLKYKVMVLIVLYCGLRLGELTALEWEDINVENKTLRINKQLQYLPKKGTYEIKDAKTLSGNRIISIAQSLIDLLSIYREWQETEKENHGNKWIDTKKIFTQENGSYIYPGTPSQWFKNFIKRNNLPPLTFHQLRHTNASLLIGEGVDIATVSKRLGHADKSVTLRTYTHPINEYDAEASEKLDKLFKD